MGSRLFHAIVIAGTALVEACGSPSGNGPEGSGKSVAFGGSQSDERVPATPTVLEAQDAAALKAATDALVDDANTKSDLDVSNEGMEGDASSRPGWGSILVK